MKKMKFNKIIIGLSIALVVVFAFTLKTLAADEITQIDAASVTSEGNSTNSNSNSNSNSNNTNSNSNNTNTNNTNANRNNTNVNNNVTNYNNTNLPSTGAASNTVLFISIGALVVLAVVAYRKVNLYKNI